MVVKKKKKNQNPPKLIFQVRSIKQESCHKDLLSLGKTVILMPGSLSFINGRFPDFLSSSLISKMFFAQTFPWTRPLSSYEQKWTFYILTKKILKRYLKTNTLQHEGNIKENNDHRLSWSNLRHFSCSSQSYSL